nr:hypothetical protein [Rhodoferax sp.]
MSKFGMQETTISTPHALRHSAASLLLCAIAANAHPAPSCNAQDPMSGDPISLQKWRSKCDKSRLA